MGKVTLKRKTFNQIPVYGGQTVIFRFKGPAGSTLSSFMDPASSQIATFAESFNLYLNSLDGSPTTFLTDGIDWYDGGGSSLMNDYVIPQNSIFVINNPGTVAVMLFLNGNAENYYQGKTNTKKQNQTILKPYSIDGGGTIYDSKNVYIYKGSDKLNILKSLNFYNYGLYIFRSATTNLLGTIFNQAQFEPYSDGLTIYTEGSLTGANSVFFTEGSTWVYDDYSTNADAYVIPANSILAFSTSNDLNITIGGGANIELLNALRVLFNKDEFLGGATTTTADNFFIQEPNGTFRHCFYYDDGFGGDIDPLQWNILGVFGDQGNYIIQPNSIIYMQPQSNKNFNITNGAIIQKYFNGDSQIEKTYFDNFSLLNTNSTLVKLKLNGFPTFGQLFGGSAFINLNNGENTDNKFLFNTNFTNLIEFLDQNLQSIAVYFPYAGSFYDVVSLDEHTDNDSISIGGIWNNKQNVIPTYLVTSKGEPYSDAVIKLFNNNLAKVIERG